MIRPGTATIEALKLLEANDGKTSSAIYTAAATENRNLIHHRLMRLREQGLATSDDEVPMRWHLTHAGRTMLAKDRLRPLWCPTCKANRPSVKTALEPGQTFCPPHRELMDRIKAELAAEAPKRGGKLKVVGETFIDLDFENAA